MATFMLVIVITKGSRYFHTNQLLSYFATLIRNFCSYIASVISVVNNVAIFALQSNFFTAITAIDYCLLMLIKQK